MNASRKKETGERRKEAEEEKGLFTKKLISRGFLVVKEAYPSPSFVNNNLNYKIFLQNLTRISSETIMPVKSYKKTYIYIEREERKYCHCKQLVCGKLFHKRRPFNSLYSRCPFGWVEENRALFLVLQLLENPHTYIGV